MKPGSELFTAWCQMATAVLFMTLAMLERYAIISLLLFVVGYLIFRSGISNWSQVVSVKQEEK